MRKTATAFLTLLAVAFVTAMIPDPFALRYEELAIRAAVAQYADAVYDGDVEALHRAVHRAAWKRPAVVDGEAAPRLVPPIDATGRPCPVRVPEPVGPRRVIVYDVKGNTATARLTASWGVDYLHLARLEGRWQIVGILGDVAPTG
jgi:hypothetical protein